MGRRVAVGGTFEVLHKGHRALLARAFREGGPVLIGLTSDRMATGSRGRRVRPFGEREATLREHLDGVYPGREYVIEAIEDVFGPAVHLEDLEMLVVSEDTLTTGLDLNDARAERGLPTLELVLVPHVMAEDGEPISSSRVLAGECDEDGHVPQGADEG